MYTKGSQEFILLEKLYRAFKGAVKPEASSLGIAANKFETTPAVIARLKEDGCLSEIPRERWVALWITDRGRLIYEKLIAPDAPVLQPLPPKVARLLELQKKHITKVITPEEKAELIDLFLELR